MSSITELQRQADEAKTQLAVVSNSTTEDFEWKYDGKNYKIPAGESKKFSKPIARHLAKHLLDRMIRGTNLANIPFSKKYREKKKELWKKIYKDL